MSVHTLSAILRGENVPWSRLGLTPAQLLDLCAQEDLAGLVHEQLSRGRGAGDWPPRVLEELARAARAETALELLRRRELVATLDALAGASIRPILFKGTALAYSVYDVPAARPRADTDLLVPRDGIDAVRRAMTRLGYAETVYCYGELLFCQFEMKKTDAFDVVHALDFHWKISTQAVFADALTYDELDREAVEVPALGPHARIAGPVHASLVACVHPVIHHRNVERLIWIYDVHLLASRLSDAEFVRFADLAQANRVAAIAAHELRLAQTHFGTLVPNAVVARLAAEPLTEPSAAYLRSNRRWHHELASSLRALRSWNERARLLREVLVPNPEYMLNASGITPGPVGTALLPALYVGRVLRGLAKMLTGRK